MRTTIISATTSSIDPSSMPDSLQPGPPVVDEKPSGQSLLESPVIAYLSLADIGDDSFTSPPPILNNAASKRNRALIELLSSERTYASDLALIRDIHIPLALGAYSRDD